MFVDNTFAEFIISVLLPPPRSPSRPSSPSHLTPPSLPSFMHRTSQRAVVVFPADVRGIRHCVALISFYYFPRLYLYAYTLLRGAGEHFFNGAYNSSDYTQRSRKRVGVYVQFFFFPFVLWCGIFFRPPSARTSQNRHYCHTLDPRRIQ